MGTSPAYHLYMWVFWVIKKIIINKNTFWICWTFKILQILITWGAFKSFYPKIVRNSSMLYSKYAKIQKDQTNFLRSWFLKFQEPISLLKFKEFSHGEIIFSLQVQFLNLLLFIWPVWNLNKSKEIEISASLEIF